jgi:hypothetical protein
VCKWAPFGRLIRIFRHGTYRIHIIQVTSLLYSTSMLSRRVATISTTRCCFQTCSNQNPFPLDGLLSFLVGLLTHSLRAPLPFLFVCRSLRFASCTQCIWPAVADLGCHQPHFHSVTCKVFASSLVEAAQNYGICICHASNTIGVDWDNWICTGRGMSPLDFACCPIVQ